MTGPRDVCFTVDGVYTPDECAALVAWAEAQGFDSAPVTTRLGMVHLPGVRNNTRVMVDDAERAAALWQRIRAHVPAELGGWRAVGLNERLRIYRYTPGRYFRRHRDGAYARSRDERSRLTLMVYLNGGFAGGGTSFRDRVVTPVAGRALVFAHPIQHQGDEVLAGTKYALRTDVMYRRG